MQSIPSNFSPKKVGYFDLNCKKPPCVHCFDFCALFWLYCRESKSSSFAFESVVASGSYGLLCKPQRSYKVIKTKPKGLIGEITE